MKSAGATLRKILFTGRNSQQLRHFRTPSRTDIVYKPTPRVISENSSNEEFRQFSLKIRELLDDQQLEYFENVIRKVEKIEHPVADLLRVQLHNPLLDVIMKLVTKMANGSPTISKDQQNLASAIQLIHIGNFVHQKGMYDLSKIPNYGNSLPADHDLILGNKIALLAGDFLLANAQMKVTNLRDDKVLKIISRAMCDVVDSTFIGSLSKYDLPLPFRPGQIPKMSSTAFKDCLEPLKTVGKSGTAEDECMLRQTISRGYLIGKGCYSSAVLAKQSESVQKNCFELGKAFFLACQAFSDMQSFEEVCFAKTQEVNLLSAPTLFHLSHEPSLYDVIVLEADSLDGIDHSRLHNKIINGPGMELTDKLVQKLKVKTETHLKNFIDCDEKSEIEKMLKQF